MPLTGTTCLSLRRHHAAHTDCPAPHIKHLTSSFSLERFVELQGKVVDWTDPLASMEHQQDCGSLVVVQTGS